MADYPSPSNQPQYDPLPPPPTARGNDGCWKWGGLGCGLGCLSLAIVFAAFLFIAFPQIRPIMSECMKLESDVKLIQQQMRQTLAALERYRDDKGKFPLNLEALVPQYLGDRSALRYSQNPQGPNFKYTVPSGNDSGAILEYALTFELPDKRTIPIPLSLSRDGIFNTVAIPEQCTRFMQAMQ